MASIPRALQADRWYSLIPNPYRGAGARIEIVSSIVGFLLKPSVSSLPLHKRIQLLQSKSYTEEEICFALIVSRSWSQEETETAFAYSAMHRLSKSFLADDAAESARSMDRLTKVTNDREQLQLLEKGDDGLCGPCSVVIDKELRPSLGLTPGKSSKTLIGSYDEIRSNKSCPMCCLMVLSIQQDSRAVRQPPPAGHVPVSLTIAVDGRYEWYMQVDCKLQSPSSLRFFDAGRDDLRIRQSLAGSRGPAKGLQNNALKLRTPGAQQTSPELIRNWLAICEQDHGPVCNPSKDTYLKHQNPVELFLVDVSERRLIKTQSDVRYCALSYVVGKALVLQKPEYNISHLQQPQALESPTVTLPKVIEDAFVVVDAIGERYLWVDSLCIVQDDPVQRQQSIMNMDLIYKGAILTIVAMSGEDGDMPLPGVRPWSRPPQLAAVIRDMGLIVTPPSLTRTLRTSKYESRGWTFQERLLSRRCLYFSSTQLYFECARLSETETGPPPFISESKEFWGPDDPQRGNRLQELSSDTKSLDSVLLFGKYRSLVEVYWTRNLSRSDDILNAFSGILADFQRRTGTGFVCGLPESALDRALLWAPTGPLQRRQSAVSVDGKRKILYPSWSWAGWVGKVAWLHVATGFAGPGDKTPELKSAIHSFTFRSEEHLRTITSRGLQAQAGTQSWTRFALIKILSLGLLALLSLAPSWLYWDGADSKIVDWFDGFLTEYTTTTGGTPDAPSSEADPIPSTDPTANVLGFTTDTVHASQFSIMDVEQVLESPRFIRSRIKDSAGRRCGVLYGKTPTGLKGDESNTYEFARLSKSPSRERNDHWNLSAMISPEGGEVFDGSFDVKRGIVNTMLIKWNGEFAERVALSQMHVDAFIAADPTQKNIQLI